MKHSKLVTAIAAATVALAVAGCGGGGGGSYGGDPAPPAPPPPPTGVTPTNFTAFTRSQMVPSATTDMAEAFDIETTEWVFPDGESETVYDDVIASAE